MQAYEAAIACTENTTERAFLQRRRQSLTRGLTRRRTHGS